MIRRAEWSACVEAHEAQKTIDLLTSFQALQPSGISTSIRFVRFVSFVSFVCLVFFVVPCFSGFVVSGYNPRLCR